MANLMRLRCLQRLVSRVPSLSARGPVAGTLSQCRGLGTSASQRSDKEQLVTGDRNVPEEDPSKPKKAWISYGFDSTSQYADRHYMHVLSFVVISLCLTFGGYIIAYMPDNRYKDWAQREAYLVLREREAAGLPPIDINVIDPAKVKLPSDEELGNTDIII